MRESGVAVSVMVGLVAAFATALTGCTASDDPCAALQCEEGFACVVGSSGPVCAPPSDPCGSPDACEADETCVVALDGRARCLAPDRCRTVQCPVGKACNAATGECSIDKAPCEGVFCPLGQACDETTGRCAAPVNLCDGVCCGQYEVCNPENGKCVDNQCDILSVACKCGPAQVCEPVTGDCLSAPGACDGCTSNQYCDEKRGACVTIETGRVAAGRVGAACTKTSQCTGAGADAFCIEDKGLFGEMPGGMCSASCDLVGCPSGSGCVDVGLQICLDLCLSHSDCRDGYECLAITSSDARTFCFPQGSGGSQCEGASCGRLGDECAVDDDCVKGARCSNLVGGYCLMNNCRPSDCASADDYCMCLGIGDCAGSTIGLGKCKLGVQDCRPGYSCYRASSTKYGYDDDGYCYPRSCEADSDCRQEGNACSMEICQKSRGLCLDPCRSDGDCVGGDACEVSTGRCYTPCSSPSDLCGPDGFCNTDIGECERRCRGDATCDAHSFCEMSSGKCLPRCTTDQSCQASEFCDPSGRCRVRCTADDGCSSNEICEAGRCERRCTGAASCGTGQFCHLDSGRCHRDLRQTAVGAKCSTDIQCGPVHATCLTGESWPGGYCSSTGCSENEPCTDGAVCVSEGGESYCLRACDEVGENACRAGYRCESVAGHRACRPL